LVVKPSVFGVRGGGGVLGGAGGGARGYEVGELPFLAVFGELVGGFSLELDHVGEVGKFVCS
jgi:hypothetical protein